jgi:acyl-coenzyme A thioesterase PaaI-like protein
VIAAVLDVAAGLAIHLAVGRQRAEEPAEGHFPTIGTIDLRVDYLRPGRGKYFIATGRVVRSATASRSPTWRWRMIPAS